VLPEEVLARTERLVIEGRVKVLGEVGLDRSFRAETYDAQMKLFLGFLKIATEYELGVSIHAAGAWKDVFSLVKSYKVPTAVFHWYTGPHDLLNEIVAEGYFIGINPAIIVQKKHEDVLRRAPLEAILTESDGPYRYRGMTLGPEMLKDLVRKVAEIKSVDPEVVIEQVKRNFITFLSNIRA
jgi:TatD DNase family protein